MKAMRNGKVHLKIINPLYNNSNKKSRGEELLKGQSTKDHVNCQTGVLLGVMALSKLKIT